MVRTQSGPLLHINGIVSSNYFVIQHPKNEMDLWCDGSPRQGTLVVVTLTGQPFVVPLSTFTGRCISRTCLLEPLAFRLPIHMALDPSTSAISALSSSSLIKLQASRCCYSQRSPTKAPDQHPISVPASWQPSRTREASQRRVNQCSIPLLSLSRITVGGLSSTWQHSHPTIRA